MSERGGWQRVLHNRRALAAGVVLLLVIGVVVVVQVRRDSSSASRPGTTVLESDASHVKLHIELGDATLTDQVEEGNTYRRMTMPGGSEDTGAVGAPSIPRFVEMVAVPEGAGVNVSVAAASTYQVHDAMLWPAQPGDPAQGDGEIGPPAPFVFDAAAYSSSNPYPAERAEVASLSSMRGLRIAVISIAGAQYVASTRELTVLRGVDLRVDFTGDFAPTLGDAYGSPWDTALAAVLPITVNGDSDVWRKVTQDVLTVCGEEMIVVTNGALRPAADAFARARTASGLLTSVMQTDGLDGVGRTTTQIRDAIRGEMSRPGCVHPGYVTIVGDEQMIPTFKVTVPNPGGDRPVDVAGDTPYGFIHQAAQWDTGNYDDVGSDLYVGRVPASDLTTAQSTLSKIVDYETNPPFDDLDFYNNLLGISYFQQCNGADCESNETPKAQESGSTPFVSASETVKAAAELAGKHVDRITTDSGTQVQPKQLSDGRPVPNDMTFDGTTFAILNEINAGRSLIWYVGHGSTNGWAEPGFGVGEIGQLSNGRHLPVVWSTGCDTGNFDHGDPSFAGNLLLHDGGGAVTVLAPTRFSRTTADGDLTKDLAKFLFPVHGAPVVKVGPLLWWMKNELRGQFGKGLPGDARAHAVMFEDFGDPSMQIWRDVPRRFDTGHGAAQVGDAHHVHVTVPDAPDGTLVTLTNADGAYLGRTVLSDNEAAVATDADVTGAAGLAIILTRDGYVPATIPLASSGPPHITRLDPASGYARAGDEILIEGDGFGDATSVTFGGAPATILNDPSQSHTNELTVHPPPGSGTVDVVVTNPRGASTPDAASRYSYIPMVDGLRPNSGPTTGGTAVTIDGAGFATATHVYWHDVDVPFKVVDDEHISVTSPPGSGVAGVVVETPGGRSDSAPGGSSSSSSGQEPGVLFTYQRAVTPAVTGVSPSVGPTGGGTTVRIVGTGFTNATQVAFGGQSASFQVIDDGTIDAVAPPLPSPPTTVSPPQVSTVEIAVSNSNGTSLTNPRVDQYTYADKPVVTGLDPSSEPSGTGGGRPVTITGSGFTGATQVVFGDHPARFTVMDDHTIHAFSPDTTDEGYFDVRVMGPGGTSDVNPDDKYHYIPRPR